MSKLIFDGNKLSFVSDTGEVYTRTDQRFYEPDEVDALMDELRKLEDEPTGKKPGRKELQS